MSTVNPYAAALSEAERQHVERQAEADRTERDERARSANKIAEIAAFIEDVVKPELAQANEHLSASGLGVVLDEPRGGSYPGMLQFYLVKVDLQVSEVYGISLVSQPPLYRLNDFSKMDHLNRNPFFKPSKRAPVVQENLTPYFDVPKEWNVDIVRDFVVAIISDAIAPGSDKSIRSRIRKSLG